MTWEYATAWIFRLLFFVALGLIISRLGQIMAQGQEASERLEKENSRRAKTLDDLIQLTMLLERRQDTLVNETFGRIEAKIDETKQLTIASAEASTQALDGSNHMNEKLKESHQNVIDTIRGLHQPQTAVVVEVAAPASEKKKKGDR